MYRAPILDFDDWRADPSVHVQWKDGTILGNFNSETIARDKAEEARKQELRNRDVVVLKDWSTKKDEACI